MKKPHKVGKIENMVTVDAVTKVVRATIDTAKLTDAQYREALSLGIAQMHLQGKLNAIDLAE